MRSTFETVQALANPILMILHDALTQLDIPVGSYKGFHHATASNLSELG